MKTFVAVLSLPIIAAIVGVFAAQKLHEMTTAAGGANAVLRTTKAGRISQQHIQHDPDHSVGDAVQQGRPVTDEKTGLDHAFIQ
jgi:hypothetical protein